MALALITLQFFKEIHHTIAPKDSDDEKRLLFFGYPDMLVGKSKLVSLFGQEMEDLPIHPDSDKIIRWHNVGSMVDEVVESVAFFNRLGYKVDILDITKARGDEIIIDLNEPVEASYYEKYDLIFDNGTLEHCFNIAQAMKNLAMMVKKGGFILQGNPLNWFNHGFYNLNPTFYYDFYNDNGFQILHFDAIVNPVFDPQTFEIPAYKRFTGIPDNTSNNLVVQRQEVVPIRWPIQNKYKNNPNLQG
jgi:hypothetical protein